MLPPWLIEQKEQERQRREDEASWHRQPRLEAPRPAPLEGRDVPPPDDSRRGSWDVDYTI